MSLADSSHFSHFPPPFSFFSPKKRHSSPSPAFDEALVSRLKSLLPIDQSKPSITLSWLARAADVLALTLSDAAGVISDPALEGSDKASLESHLNASVSLLDAANAFSAALDSVLRRRLLLRLAFHVLRSGNTCKARDYIAEWEEASPESPTGCSATDLIELLAPSDPPRGKISAVRRAVYASEAVSRLVAGTIAAVLRGETVDLKGIRASNNFPWAAAYNEVVLAVSDHLHGRPAAEVAAVESSVRELAVVMDDVAEGEEGRARRINAAAAAAEKAVEGMAEAAERLAGAVDRMFREGLGMRRAALECFRIAPQKCQQIKKEG